MLRKLDDIMSKKTGTTFEPRHEKTEFLRMRKQRRRSAMQ